MTQTPIRVVLNVEGGVVHNIRATGPVEVIILDTDTEGADPSHCATIDGEEVYVITDTPEVNPESLAATLTSVDAYLEQ